MRPLNDVRTTLRQKGHGILLLSLMLLILANPFLVERASLSWLLSLIFVLVLLAAARTASEYRWQRIITLILGVPALLAQLGLLISDMSWLEPVRYIASALFMFYVCGLLLSDIVLHSQTVTLNLIRGAVNVYLMFGIGFAFIYGLIEYLQPGSFTGLEELAVIHDRIMYFLYFSYITLSTLGYGDISPLTPYGMTAAYTEAIFGQLYLAILVARLVALQIGSGKSSVEEPDSRG